MGKGYLRKDAALRLLLGAAAALHASLAAAAIHTLGAPTGATTFGNAAAASASFFYAPLLSLRIQGYLFEARTQL
jgi:hypothetical protein